MKPNLMAQAIEALAARMTEPPWWADFVAHFNSRRGGDSTKDVA